MRKPYYDSGKLSYAPKVITTIIVSILMSVTATGQSLTPSAYNSLRFIENLGQWPAEVRYKAKAEGVEMWVTDDAILYDFYKVERIGKRRGSMEEYDDPFDYIFGDSLHRYGHVVKMSFVNSEQDKRRMAETRRTTSALGFNRTEARHSFLRGSDKSEWVRDAASYREAYIKDVYVDIDTRLYFDEGRARYDLIVKPGAKPEDIKIRLESASDLRVNARGELEFRTALGKIEQRGLFVYQRQKGKRRQVGARFRAHEDNTIRVEVDEYDSTKTLIIDPVFYSTYLGGTNDDAVRDLEVDEFSRPVVTGLTSSSNFPSTLGAYDQSVRGNQDVFVAKLTGDGTDLLFSTVLGGSGIDRGYACDLDPDGDIYVTGITYSNNFPLASALYGTFGGVYDLFILKLSSDGSQLLYSTYVGGSDRDLGWELYVNDNEEVFVSGISRSNNFPTQNPVQASRAGDNDAVILKLAAGGQSLVYSTYFGGSGKDNGYQLAPDVGVGTNNDIYVTGYTESDDFPVSTNPYQASRNGFRDAFILKLGSTGATVYCTYLGGQSHDRGLTIKVNASKEAIVAGETNSDDFPTSTTAYDSALNGNSDAFVFCLSSTGGSMVYSTYLGGDADDTAWDLSLTNNSGEVCVTGRTTSSDYPTTTNGTARAGAEDAIVTEVRNFGAALGYSTHLGGSGDDIGFGIVYDPNFDKFVVGGSTESSNFPTPAGAYDNSFNN